MTPEQVRLKAEALAELKKAAALMDAITTLAHHIYASDPDDLTKLYIDKLIQTANKVFERLDS